MNVGPTRSAHQATQTVDQALGQSAPMARLLGALAASERCWQAAQGALPPALRPHVRSGPCLDGRWCLFAPNGAVASKLKHCLPLMEAALRDAGLPDTQIAVRILSPGGEAPAAR